VGSRKNRSKASHLMLQKVDPRFWNRVTRFPGLAKIGRQGWGQTYL